MKKISMLFVLASITFSNVYAEQTSLSQEAIELTNEIARNHAQIEKSISFYKGEISNIRGQIQDLKDNSDLEFTLTTRKL